MDFLLLLTRRCTTGGTRKGDMLTDLLQGQRATGADGFCMLTVLTRAVFSEVAQASRGKGPVRVIMRVHARVCVLVSPFLQSPSI